MFFTNKGRVYRLKAYEIPESGRTARGTAIINLLQLTPGEKVNAIIPIRGYDEHRYLFMATKKGMVKKTSIQEYANIRKIGLQAINLRDDDELIEVKSTNSKKDIILVTKHGQCIRFHETDVRPTGRATMGVIGMNLLYDDEVIGMQLDTQGEYLMLVSEYGMGKRTKISEFTPQHRGGKGIKCYKITEKTGNVVSVKSVNEDNEIMLITTEGIIIQMRVDEISSLGRITSGVKLIDLDPTKDIVVATMAKVRDAEPKSDDKDMLQQMEQEMLQNEEE
jgi:DNA gyrase subunit A